MIFKVKTFIFLIVFIVLIIVNILTIMDWHNFREYENIEDIKETTKLYTPHTFEVYGWYSLWEGKTSYVTFMMLEDVVDEFIDKNEFNSNMMTNCLDKQYLYQTFRSYDFKPKNWIDDSLIILDAYDGDTNQFIIGKSSPNSIYVKIILTNFKASGL